MVAMSRAERERRAEAQEQWPALQDFVFSNLANCLFGDMATLQAKLGALLPELGHDERARLACEAFSFLGAFRERHDDQSFLKDAFGVEGRLQSDDRGRGQVGRARIKVLYDALATSVKREDPGWSPKS